MSALSGKIRALAQMEQQLCEGESLLRKADRTILAGWFIVGAGLLVMVALGGVFVILGLLAITIGIWRIYRGMQYIQEIEAGLQDLRIRKVKRMAALMNEEHRDSPGTPMG